MCSSDLAQQLLAQLQTETDNSKRAELAKQLNDEVADKVLNMVPVAEPQAITAWNPQRLKGFKTDPYSFYYHVDDAWLAK